MNIEEVLDVLDELLDKSLSLPFSNGRCVVDAEKVRDYIDDIRIHLPTEIKNAKSIVAERAEIIGAAKREGEAIIRRAEERAKALVAQEEIVKAAQAKAADIMTQAQVKSREMRQATQEFSDDILRTTEEAMVKSITELRTTRQALRNRGRQQR